MKAEIRAHLAQQGLGTTLGPIRCPKCNYLAVLWSEKMLLIKKGEPCPNCKSTNKTARIALDNYTEVGNWLGEYAVSDSRRDHTSAVILFCALTEAILETIIEDYLELHPDRKLLVATKDKRTIKDVLGLSLTDLLRAAPVSVKTFPQQWEVLRTKRNRFLHGRSSSFGMTKDDAEKAMDYAPAAINVFAWLNNKYCLK
jgi:phage FluMu protein Com